LTPFFGMLDPAEWGFGGLANELLAGVVEDPAPEEELTDNAARSLTRSSFESLGESPDAAAPPPLKIRARALR
jgi:hypothetical protein